MKISYLYPICNRDNSNTIQQFFSGYFYLGRKKYTVIPSDANELKLKEDLNKNICLQNTFKVALYATIIFPIIAAFYKFIEILSISDKKIILIPEKIEALQNKKNPNNPINGKKEIAFVQLPILPPRPQNEILQAFPKENPQENLNKPMQVQVVAKPHSPYEGKNKVLQNVPKVNVQITEKKEAKDIVTVTLVENLIQRARASEHTVDFRINRAGDLDDFKKSIQVVLKDFYDFFNLIKNENLQLKLTKDDDTKHVGYFKIVRSKPDKYCIFHDSFNKDNRLNVRTSEGIKEFKVWEYDLSYILYLFFKDLVKDEETQFVLPDEIQTSRLNAGFYFTTKVNQ